MSYISGPVSNVFIIHFCLQTVQHTMAEMKTEICVGRAFVDSVNKIHNDTKLDTVMASMAKYWFVAQFCFARTSNNSYGVQAVAALRARIWNINFVHYCSVIAFIRYSPYTDYKIEEMSVNKTLFIPELI
jgi:hypothetical protein